MTKSMTCALVIFTLSIPAFAAAQTQLKHKVDVTKLSPQVLQTLVDNMYIKIDQLESKNAELKTELVKSKKVIAKLKKQAKTLKTQVPESKTKTDNQSVYQKNAKLIKKMRLNGLKKKRSLNKIIGATSFEAGLFWPGHINSHSDLVKGNIGIIGNNNNSEPTYKKVFQVIDSHNVIIYLVTPFTSHVYNLDGTRSHLLYSSIQSSAASTPGTLVWVSGINTKGMTNEKRATIPGLFKVVGTKTYSTSIGGSNTIYELKSTGMTVKGVRNYIKQKIINRNK